MVNTKVVQLQLVPIAKERQARTTAVRFANDSILLPELLSSGHPVVAHTPVSKSNIITGETIKAEIVLKSAIGISQPGTKLAIQ